MSNFYDAYEAPTTPEESTEYSVIGFIIELVIPFAVILALGIAIWCMASKSEAAITGASSCNAGEIAIFESDAPAAWDIFPPEYKGSLYVDSNGSKAAFASPIKGVVYVITSTIVDGKPTISSLVFYNGEAPDDFDDDFPPDETEEPENTVADVVKSATVTATAAEKQAIANAFSAVCSGIDRRTITTESGARETFRRVWASQAVNAGTGVIDKYKSMLDRVSDLTAKSNLKEIREQYEQAVIAVGFRLQ